MTFGRTGWTDALVTLSTKGGPRPVKAMQFGDLAVHRMICETGEDVGWTISHAGLGLRIASMGRVFKTREGAMSVVEAMYPAFTDWVLFFTAEKDDSRVKRAMRAHDEAEFEDLFIEHYRVAVAGMPR